MSDSGVQGGPCRPRGTLQPSRDPAWRPAGKTAPEPADTDGGGDTCWGQGSPVRAPGLGLSPDPQPRGGRTPSLGNHPRLGPPPPRGRPSPRPELTDRRRRYRAAGPPAGPWCRTWGSRPPPHWSRIPLWSCLPL